MTPPGKRKPRRATRPRPVKVAVAGPTAEAAVLEAQLSEVLSDLDRARAELAALPGKAKPYTLFVNWRCSARCGQPIRLGDMCVTTSEGFKPWERAHAACVAGRKGSDENRPPAEAIAEVLREAGWDLPAPALVTVP